MLLGKLDFNSTIAGRPELSAVECKNIFSSAKHSFSLLRCFRGVFWVEIFIFFVYRHHGSGNDHCVVFFLFFLPLSNRRRFGMFTWQSGKCKKDNLISPSFFFSVCCVVFFFLAIVTISTRNCRLSHAGSRARHPHWMLFWRLHWRWLRWHSRDPPECRVWYYVKRMTFIKFNTQLNFSLSRSWHFKMPLLLCVALEWNLGKKWNVVDDDDGDNRQTKKQERALGENWYLPMEAWEGGEMKSGKLNLFAIESSSQQRTKRKKITENLINIVISASRTCGCDSIHSLCFCMFRIISHYYINFRSSSSYLSPHRRVESFGRPSTRYCRQLSGPLVINSKHNRKKSSSPLHSALLSLLLISSSKWILHNDMIIWINDGRIKRALGRVGTIRKMELLIREFNRNTRHFAACSCWYHKTFDIASTLIRSLFRVFFSLVC